MPMTTIVLVSIATALFVICCVGTCGCAWMWSRYLTRRRVHARLANPMHGHKTCCGRPAEKPRETRLQALQRLFVSGQITLDEYERDIDRLHRRIEPA